MQGACRLTFRTLSGYRKHLISKHAARIKTSSTTTKAVPDHQSETCYEGSVLGKNNNTEGNLEQLHQEKALFVGESSEQEDVSFETQTERLPDIAAKFVAELRARTNVPASHTNKVIQTAQDLVISVLQTVQQDVMDILSEPQYAANSELRSDIQDVFENSKNPFSELMSDTQQKKYFSEKGDFIQPCEVLLGTCLKPKIDQKTGDPLQSTQKETFQYIPLADTIKQYLERPGVMNAILSQKGSKDNDVLYSFKDGHYYKRQEATARQDCEFLVPLLLYNDEFETANPLGSKRGKHKVSAFYTSVLSLPRKYQARLENIMLTAMITSPLLSKYGISEVLKVIKDDLQQMWTDGLTIKCKEFEGRVKPYLFQVVGDNLGIHAMLGCTTCFRANYYCRFCRGHRSLLQKQPKEDAQYLRDEINYDTDLQKPLSESGLKHATVLNELPYYHSTQNLCPDVMHDFTEGVLPLEMHLVLSKLVQKGFITLDEVNSRISSFNFGFVDRKNRPSPIRQASLKNPYSASGQTSAQMTCLAYNIPLMLGDKIDEMCDEWELLLSIIDIFKIIMSPSISKSAIYVLKAMIDDHHRLFMQLFPEASLTPKQHFLVHYPRALKHLGPLTQYSALRFEAMHRPFKQIASVSCNYQNIVKTLANRYQMARCYRSVSNQSLDSQDINVSQQAAAMLGDLLDDEALCKKINCGRGTEVTVAGKVDIHGYEFRAGVDVLLYWTDDDGPTFGRVQHIVVVQEKLYLLLRLYQTLYFNRHVEAFAVQVGREEAQAAVEWCDLFDHRPVNAVQSYSGRGRCLYIVVHHSFI